MLSFLKITSLRYEKPYYNPQTRLKFQLQNNIWQFQNAMAWDYRMFLTRKTIRPAKNSCQKTAKENVKAKMRWGKPKKSNCTKSRMQWI
jgi:hypothetical protein